jgi:tetratricopeptide (TPR) repeat protein
MKIAEDIYLDGELERALEEYDRVLEMAPRNIDALKMRGMVCEDLGLYERAIHDYLRILDLDPDNREAYKLYSEAMISQAENTPEGELPEGEDEEQAPPVAPPAIYLEPSANLRGWPGHRNRPERSGLDYVENQAEAGHMAGVFMSNFLRGKLLTDNPLYQLLLGGGAAAFLLLAALLLLAAGGSGFIPAAGMAIVGVLFGWSFFNSLARQDD